MNRRMLMAGSIALPMMSRNARRTAAQTTPEADDSLPGVVTVTTPILLEDGVIIDHYRVTGHSDTGDAVVLGSITNFRDDSVAIPAFSFEVSVRDEDRVILGSTSATPVYRVIERGKSIGFVARFYGLASDEVDPLTVSFEVGAFSSDDPILDELEEATLEIESEEVISNVDDLQIEYVVRNTSDLEYSGLTPRIAVWDADWLFCGNASASVYTAIPAGDAIRFTTNSTGGTFNPLDIAGDDFTLEPWITPTIA